MTITFRKILFAAVTLVSVAGAVLPASAHDWGGWDRGGGWERGGWDRGGWGERHGGWHHRGGWDRPRCWIEDRRVWVDTPWGPRERIAPMRICR